MQIYPYVIALPYLYEKISINFVIKDLMMNAMAIKGRLHEYIETADNEHLAAIYVLLQKDMEPSNQYDEDTLKMLYQRLEDDMKGLSKSYTVAEAMASVRGLKNK